MTNNEDQALNNTACGDPVEGSQVHPESAMPSIRAKGASPDQKRATLADALRHAALDLLDHNRAAGACIEIEGEPPLYVLVGHAAAMGKLLPGATTVSASREALTSLDYRAQGREEALDIILAQDPEEPFGDCTRTSANGDSGDYSTYWNEDKLRELLHIDDRKHDAYDRAEAMYWEAQGHKDEAAREMRMVELAPYYKPLHDFLSAHEAWDLLADLKRPEAPAPSREAAPLDDQARKERENAEFTEWWASSGQKAAHNLITENAAHATWQERARRAALAQQSADLVAGGELPPPFAWARRYVSPAEYEWEKSQPVTELHQNEHFAAKCPEENTALYTADQLREAVAAARAGSNAGVACTYPNCACIGGGVFKPCVKQASAPVGEKGGAA